MAEQCNWCGEPVEAGEGWRAFEQPGAREAAFCRLEHVVPWAMQGAHWDPAGASPTAVEADSCSQCGEPLGDVRILLVRHRGDHRIPDGFCSADHMADWAKSGGRWR
jgi:hypothetical protein